MKTDELIDHLVLDARPRRPAGGPGAASVLWWFPALAFSVTSAVVAFGLRADARSAIPTARWFLATLGFLATAGVCAFVVQCLSRPGRGISHRVPVGLVSALFPLGLGLVLYGAMHGGLDAAGFDIGGLSCAEAIIGLALAPAVALFMMARRLAPMAPRAVGVAIGIAAGAVANVGLIVHCPIENLWHLGLYHILPLALLAWGGAMAGKRLLAW